jgi:hypothetical protein
LVATAAAVITASMDALLAGVSPFSFKPTRIGWIIHPISFAVEFLRADTMTHP